MLELLHRFIADESGQDLIEYALLAVLIAVAAIAASSNLGTKVSSEFTKIGTYLS